MKLGDTPKNKTKLTLSFYYCQSKKNNEKFKTEKNRRKKLFSAQN